MSLESWTPTGASLLTGTASTTREIWPYCPRTPVIETLEWATDVIQAKNGEQSIALRPNPRRTFNYSHTFTDYEAAGAMALVRSVQAAGKFLVPDWTMAVGVTDIQPGSAETVTVDLGYFDYGDKALLWGSPDKFEQVNFERDSSNTVVIDPVVNTYETGYLMPLWEGILPSPLEFDRIGARYNEASVSFVATENNDLAASQYVTYRGEDVMTDCPLVSGDLGESITWPATTIDSLQNEPGRIRSRGYPTYEFTMRWHCNTDAELWTLRRWLHSRKGRQKAFWFSTFSQDFRAVGLVSTNLFVGLLRGATGIGHGDAFHIEVKTNDGASYFRQVTAVYDGPEYNNEPTLVLTLDSELTGVAFGDITRVSYLRCARFNADRIELLHRAAGGTSVQVPCLEILEP